MAHKTSRPPKSTSPWQGNSWLGTQRPQRVLKSVSQGAPCFQKDRATRVSGFFRCPCRLIRCARTEIQSRFAQHSNRCGRQSALLSLQYCRLNTPLWKVVSDEPRWAIFNPRARHFLKTWSVTNSRIPELESQSKEFVHAKSTAHRCWCSLAGSNAVNCLVWRWTRSAASMPYM